MANRLRDSTSPYLLQHAHNPVDWYPWGDEAFAAARAADKPVLLSVGYSACHWCHVMAHESFDSPRTAGVMNALFVNIKVDREERPDVDAVYMEAVQAMTGHGGWPLTVFLTPDGQPFYGGTYFPPEPRGGLPAFHELLAAVAAAWRSRRHDVLASAAGLTEALRQAVPQPTGDERSGPELLDRAVVGLMGRADHQHGGFGSAPKFPQASSLSFLLGRHVRTARSDLLAVVTAALDGMATGGIYDQLGGGFHRYSVDARWSVPHFEKMLYDNAQLLQLYAEAWQVTGVDRYRTVAEETAAYLLREMVGEHGAFYAAQDADTSQGEGATFIWRPQELSAALTAAEARAAELWFGVSDGGNFEGGSVLSARWRLAEASDALGLAVLELQALLTSAREKLLAARRDREPPATDTKVIAAWNGLAVEALARAGVILDRPDFVAAAERAARFAVEHLTTGGGPAHSWRDGKATVPAFLDDLAALANAYLSLYEATFEPAWLGAAQALMGQVLDEMADDDGGFYRTGRRHEALLVRQLDLVDAATPSGTSLAVRALLRLAALVGDPDLEAATAPTLRRLSGPMLEAPEAFGATLAALDDSRSGWREVAIVGPWDRADTRALLRVVRGAYRPALVVAWGPGGRDSAADVPLLAGRDLVAGQAAAYVCRHHVCQLPCTSPEQLAMALDSPAG